MKVFVLVLQCKVLVLIKKTWSRSWKISVLVLRKISVLVLSKSLGLVKKFLFTSLISCMCMCGCFSRLDTICVLLEQARCIIYEDVAAAVFEWQLDSMLFLSMFSICASWTIVLKH